jgi:hypothetical protein
VPEMGLEPTRDCSHRILSPPCSRTEADTEGHREIKQHFYQVLAHLEGQGGTGRDTRLRSDCGQNLRLPHPHLAAASFCV